MRKYIYLFSIVLVFGIALNIVSRLNFFMSADSALSPEFRQTVSVMSKIGIGFVTAGMCGFTGMIIVGIRRQG